MKQRRQDFVLGLTAIVFVVLFVATIMFLYPQLQGDGRLVEIHFRTEDGMAPLKTGSSVLLGGSIEVGRVRDVRVEQIELPEGQNPQKRTIFVVQAEIRDDIPLYGDCQITTGQPAIGGAGYVQILDVGSPDQPLDPPIEGQPPQSLAAAISSLSTSLLAKGGLVDQLTKAVDPEAEDSVLHKVLVSLDDLNAMTRELRTQLSPGEQKTLLAKIHLILDDINTATTALRNELAAGEETASLAKVHRALDHLNQALSEAAAMMAEDRPLVRSTLTSVERAARTLDQELLASLRAELDPDAPGSMLAKVHVAMDHVNVSLERVEAMSDTSARMVALTRPALEKTLDNFKGMSDQLHQASQEILLNPSKLIWGPKQHRAEQLVVFQAARNFAQAASQLDDAAGRLQAVLATLPAEGEAAEPFDQEIRAIHDAVRAAFERFERAEEVLWEQLK